MPTHPGYVWRQIALFCDITEILVLLRLSKTINLFLVHLLYRNVSVGKSAQKMVASLASNSLLPPLVESLYFTDFLASVDISQWAAVLPALSHLWFLIITPRIPLPPRVIPLITFRLGFFGSISCVDPPWTQLLVSQDRLLRLVITSHFNANDCPGPGKLPLLRSMKGRPADLAKFAFYHRLEDMWFYTGKSLGGAPLHPDDLAKFSASSSRLTTLRICAPGFMSLLRAAPHVVFTLRHLVLDEDLTWSAFTLNSDTLGLGGSSLAPVSCTTKPTYTLPNQTFGESPELAWALMKTKKPKRRSLLPFSVPPRPASPAMSRRQRRRQQQPPVSAAMLPEWPSVAEAQWQEMAHEVSEVVSQWAAGELSDDDEENLPPLIPLESDGETEQLAEVRGQREERDKELNHAWDYLVSQVSDTIPVINSDFAYA
ncbi:hypothetical protein B0H12DRAFT_1245567 [Mycena haematopus]|nr:hypothetical protein B0H12DRAFT_1245567 [Mycena haematopus]